MKRICRSSSRCRSLSSGAMTTNFERSKAICRSISGKVPLPIEPKPIITIGPSKRACSGPAVGRSGDRVHVGYSQAKEIDAALHAACGARTCRVAASMAGYCDEAGNDRATPPCRRPAALISPRAPSSAPRAQLAGEQAVPLVRPGQPERAGLLAGEAEAAVVGRVADQQHRAMAETRRRRAARAAPASSRCRACAQSGCDRERPEQERRPARCPAETSHSRRVPTSTATARRRPTTAVAGRRPSRKRSDVLVKRTGRRQTSSTSRAPRRRPAVRDESVTIMSSRSIQGVRCGTSSAARSR